MIFKYTFFLVKYFLFSSFQKNKTNSSVIHGWQGKTFTLRASYPFNVYIFLKCISLYSIYKWGSGCTHFWFAVKAVHHTFQSGSHRVQCCLYKSYVHIPPLRTVISIPFFKCYIVFMKCSWFCLYAFSKNFRNSSKEICSGSRPISFANWNKKFYINIFVRFRMFYNLL